MNSAKAKGGIFYGYWIALSGFFVLFCGIGILCNCISLYVKPVSDALGFGRGDFSLTFTISALYLMVGSVIAGKLLEKFNVRIIMVICWIVTAASCYMYSRCETLWQFYLAAITLGLAGGGAFLVPVPMLINNWFHEKRGLIMGVVYAGSGAGGVVGSLMIDRLIVNYGWQAGFSVPALIVGVVGLLLSIFVIRARPQDKGLLPYGQTTEIADAEAEGGNTEKVSLFKYMRGGAFWLLALTFFLGSMVGVGIQNLLAPHLTDSGYTSTFAAQIMALYMGLLIPIKVLMGGLCDKIGLTRGYVLSVLILALGSLSLLGSQYLWMVYVFVVLFALGNPVITVIYPLMTAAYLGAERFAVLFGVLNIFITLGGAIGMAVGGYMYDINKNYTATLLIFAGILVIACFTGIVAGRQGKKTIPQHL
jgi:MFS family permease